MKTILFTSSFSDLTKGGQKSTYLLIRNLDRSKYKPIIMCSESGPLMDELKKINVEPIIFLFPRLRIFNFFKIYSALKQLRNILQEYHVDIIHTESSRSTFYLGLGKKKLNLPLIWHVRISNKENFLYESLLYSLADRIITVSKAAQNRFSKFRNYKIRTTVIYNAVALDFGKNKNVEKNIRGDLNFLPDQIMVGIIGEISEIKGQLDFIEAAGIIYKKNNNIRFLIVGQGNQENEAKIKHKIQQLGLENVIIRLDFQENIEMILNQLDILVNASHNEGFSRIIIEAMALKKAVVATDVGGNAEAVEEGRTGFLVPPRNSTALASAILQLVEDSPLRNSFGCAGQDKVLKEFPLEKMIKRVEKVYEEVINS